MNAQDGVVCARPAHPVQVCIVANNFDGAQLSAACNRSPGLFGVVLARMTPWRVAVHYWESVSACMLPPMDACMP